jgi:hypothetical protein
MFFGYLSCNFSDFVYPDGIFTPRDLDYLAFQLFALAFLRGIIPETYLLPARYLMNIIFNNNYIL